MNTLKYKIIKSPVGQLKIVVNDQNLLAILWDNERLNRVKLSEMIEENTNPLIIEVEQQLNDYFSQNRTVFDLPFAYVTGTPFQQSVWKWLEEIPYGQTWSYKDIALKLNNPQAIRAVGSAIGKNPLSIIVPCHRVIGTNGQLTGFAGGTDRKQVLLDLEKKHYLQN